MRRIIQLSAACLAVSAVSACSSRDAVTETGVEPSAGVRFINAVPDTGGALGLDFRFVDLVENNAHYAIPFRNTIVTANSIPASTQIQYKNTLVGDARHFRIFLDDSIAAVASTRLGCAAGATTCIGDSTLKIENGHRYTALLWGNSRTGVTPALKLTVLDEVCDAGASKIGLRVINATASAIDVRVYQNTAVVVGSAAAVNTFTLPATPTWANVAPMSVSSCITTFDPTPMPTTVGNTVTTVTYRYNVQPAGGGTALFADQGAMIGTAIGTVANGCTVGTDCDATPGTAAAGSVLTGIVFPRSVAGTKAPQTSAFGVPAISFMWDKRPPRNPGT